MISLFSPDSHCRYTKLNTEQFLYFLYDNKPGVILNRNSFSTIVCVFTLMLKF